VTDRPDFRDLVGDDLAEAERARLERVHDLLVAAGPPPELPPSLAEPDATVQAGVLAFLPRRRTGAVLALAAAVALVAFLGGYLAGRTGDQFTKTFEKQMHGTAAARQASATIEIGKLDQDGNWPLRLVVRNLEPLRKGQYYEMFLTAHHKPVASCGTFVAGRAGTTVHLNAPYNLSRYDGWVVTREARGSRTHPVVLTT
jgi:anti-sigma-K factor RskA